MWEERLHSKKVNHRVTDILQGQRAVHQHLRHKQLGTQDFWPVYFSLTPVVSVKEPQGPWEIT